MLMEKCHQLEQTGSEFNASENPRLDYIIVNDKYRVLYCYIPKVACTNLQRIFLLLTGKVNRTYPLQIKPGEVHGALHKHLTFLHTLSAESIQYRLKHYRKVIFVREPLERFLSAYRNKFTQPGNKHVVTEYAADAIRLFRDNQLQQSLEEDHNLKFSEFVDYILYQKTHSKTFNKHWDSYFNLCSPCHIHYNFIGRFETLEEDADLLLQEMKVDQIVRFPKAVDGYQAHRTVNTLEKFYGLIDPHKISKLQDVYRLDYFLFGYQTPIAVKKLLAALQ